MKREEQIRLARQLLESGVLSEESANAIKADFPELSESEDERIIDGFRTLLDGISSKGGLTLNKVPLQKCYAYLEKQKEQKPAEWSEEDEKMRRRAICACNFTIDRTFSETHYGEARDWLKSLPIGFITNPNYNSGMVELLVSELQTIANDNGVPKQYDAEISWLKSLRPSWKPSEEQRKQ